MKKNHITGILLLTIVTILFLNFLFIQDNTENYTAKLSEKEISNTEFKIIPKSSDLRTHLLRPKKFFGLRSWAKEGDEISYYFHTYPIAWLEIWTMTEEQWLSIPNDGVITEGQYIGLSTQDSLIFKPSYAANWFIVFRNPSSSITTEVYFQFDVTPFIIIRNPTSETSTFTESTLNVEWETNFDSSVKLELYKGEVFVTTLKTSTYNDGFESVTIPESCTEGSNYRIKISEHYFTSEFDFSEPFTIRRRMITVLFPMVGDVFVPHTTRIIGWTCLGVSPSLNLSINLYLNSTHILEISSQTVNDGEFKWKIGTVLNLFNHTYSHYQIEILDSEKHKYVALSPFFTITEENSMSVTSPIDNSSFTSSKVMDIVWETDSTCYKVNIKLMKGDITIMNIGPVKNKDSFSWKIPSSIRPGIDYYFFINATDNSVSSDSQTFTIKPRLKQIPSYNISLFLISIILTVAVICKKKLKVK